MKKYKMTDSVVVDFDKDNSYQSMHEPVLKEEPKKVRKLNDVSPEEWDTAFRHYYNAS
jgi:hypothetical protein